MYEDGNKSYKTPDEWINWENVVVVGNTMVSEPDEARDAEEKDKEDKQVDILEYGLSCENSFLCGFLRGHLDLFFRH